MSATIRFDNLTVSFGDSVALDNVTAQIPSNVSVAVIGPNGSGKSTLLKAVAGILEPSSGGIQLDGNRVAIVMQSTDVDPSVPMSVRDTVTMARYPSLGLLRRLGPADRAAVDHAVEALQLDDLLDRQLHHLSGGQRQRAVVAQGLAQDAELLLLDEPLTGLDVVSRLLITDALDQAREQGRTTVTTTHSFADAERSDLVMLLATRCIAFGSPAEVLSESHLQQAFGGRFVRVGDTLVLDDPHHESSHSHVH